MFETSLIVLREILEVCFLLAMIFAAIKQHPKKWYILSGSIVGGVCISALIAFAFYRAKNLFEENAQEYLNIVILASSIICIALTLFWINNHLDKLKQKLSKSIEKSNLLPITIVIELAIAREGVELILLMHGVTAAGAVAADLIFGMICGTVIGIILAIFMYKGMLKIPNRYFFKVINIMLTLVAASMAAQLANYLSASDLITVFSSNLWDSSWLISDNSLLGKMLHSVMGYTAKPTGLQIIFYFTVIIVLSLNFKKKVLMRDVKVEDR